MERPTAPTPMKRLQQYLAEVYGITKMSQFNRKYTPEQRREMTYEWVKYLREHEHYWVEEYDAYVDDLRLFYAVNRVPVAMLVNKNDGKVLGCTHDETRVFLVDANIGILRGEMRDTFMLLDVKKPLTVDEDFALCKRKDEHGDTCLYLMNFEEEVANEQKMGRS